MITLTSPITTTKTVKEVVETPVEVNYDGIWFRRISITGAPGLTRATIQGIPFSSVTKETKDNDPRTLQITDVFGVAAENPEVAAAIVTLMTALGNLYSEKGLLDPTSPRVAVVSPTPPAPED